MKKKVVILGGGVAGLTAAHELAERDFEVHVYEKLNIAGGKARSIAIPKTADIDGRPLPGEHGFRFFPRFYIHLNDSMKRIPYGNEGKTCFDNLVDTSRVTVASNGKPPFPIVNRFPRNKKDLEDMMEVFSQDLGIGKEAAIFFADRIWQIITSCCERRFDEYERIGWWEYIEADRFNDAYRTFLAEGFTRTLVAAQPKIASTKTVGDILVQLIFDMIIPGPSSDRVLNGPTNDVWIDPWVKYLEGKLGITYHYNSEVTEFHCDKDTHKLTGIGVVQNNQVEVITADYYLSALPVEKISALINQDMIFVDPTLFHLKRLTYSTNWMNGIQYFLPKDVLNSPETHGHVLMVDSPWALTAISQRQFWVPPFSDFDQYYNKQVKGILSVDISDWFREAPIYEQHPDGSIQPVMEEDPETGQQVHVHMQANDCTKEQIVATVWIQLQHSLNGGTDRILESFVYAYLDPSIENRRIGMSKIDALKLKNSEPLLVNSVGTWFLRPQAHTRIENLYLAGDFVKTNTDLATMEGANEAARRAVNCILDDGKFEAKRCKIWRLHEPLAFAKWRHLDRMRYHKGLRWDENFSPFKLIFFYVISFFDKLFKGE